MTYLGVKFVFFAELQMFSIPVAVAWEEVLYIYIYIYPDLKSNIPSVIFAGFSQCLQEDASTTL